MVSACHQSVCHVAQLTQLTVWGSFNAVFAKLVGSCYIIICVPAVLRAGIVIAGVCVFVHLSAQNLKNY